MGVPVAKHQTCRHMNHVYLFTLKAYYGTSQVQKISIIRSLELVVSRPPRMSCIVSLPFWIQLSSVYHIYLSFEKYLPCISSNSLLCHCIQLADGGRVNEDRVQSNTILVHFLQEGSDLMRRHTQKSLKH